MCIILCPLCIVFVNIFCHHVSLAYSCFGVNFMFVFFNLGMLKCFWFFIVLYPFYIHLYCHDTFLIIIMILQYTQVQAHTVCTKQGDKNKTFNNGIGGRTTGLQTYP